MFTVDAALAMTCAEIGAAVLLGVLVFSSVLELARQSQSGQYSLNQHETTKRVSLVVGTVKALIALAAVTTSLALVAASLDVVVLRVAVLTLSVVTTLAFGVLALLVVQWLWR